MSLNNNESKIMNRSLDRHSGTSSLSGVSGVSGASSGGATTVVKYEKSSCLFCNEWFDSQTFTEHLIHCGQVLEECPNGCHVFVPRIRMRSHMKECPRGSNALAHSVGGSAGSRRPLSSSVSSGHLDQVMPVHADSRLQVLEQDIGTLRSVLNEEIRQRLHLITDVGNLRKQNQEAEEWTERTDTALHELRKRLDEENEQRSYEVEQCQHDFRYFYDAVQSVKSEIQHQIEELQNNMSRISIEVAEHQNHLNDNIMKLEETVLLHEKINCDKFGQVEDFLSTINNDLKTKFVANSDLNAKQLTMDYEVKSMKNIVCETEERCDKLETMVAALDKNMHQTMQAVADLEQHLATHQRLSSIQNSRGHLVWRIKDYSKKLEEARQYDTILHSSMFSNKPYGYALRLDIYPNGKGTWKGRNLIACLNVLAGEYDPLLPWPCRLQADIIIRDQGGPLHDPEDYVKTIQVRKKNDEFVQNNQFFHIPHKIIANANFLRNDSLYVEVRVLK